MSKTRLTINESFSIETNQDGVVEAISFGWQDEIDDGVLDPEVVNKAESIRKGARNRLTPVNKGKLTAILAILRNLRDASFPIT